MVKVGVAVALGSLMSIGMMMGGVVGGIADVALFIVVASGSKEMFARPDKTRSQAESTFSTGC